MRPLSNKVKVTLFSGILMVLGTVVGLISANFILGWYKGKIAASSVMEPGLIRYDSRLGWKLTESWQGSHVHHDFSVIYSTNSKGFRGNSLESSAKDDLPRIAVIGDSFTFGLGVDDDAVFTYLLNDLDADYHYLNLAVPGFSTDQEYILMRNWARQFSPSHYMVFFYLGNDLIDNALPYPLQAAHAKPYYRLDADGYLVLENSPVPKTSKPANFHSTTLARIAFGDTLTRKGDILPDFITRSHLYERLFPEKAVGGMQQWTPVLESRLEDQINLLSAIFAAMKREADLQDARFHIAVLPGSSYVNAPHSYAAIFQEFVRRMVVKLASDQNVPVIDVALELRHLVEQNGAAGPWFHPNEGHMTAQGHAEVARILYKYRLGDRSRFSE